MHAEDRERRILELMSATGFVTFREIEKRLDASPSTIRRDLDHLASQGKIERVRGGARAAGHSASPLASAAASLSGVPFHENIGLNRGAKQAIGRAAAALCTPGEGVMIDGGSTTLQMCPHLAGLGLQVLTNSLHIVSALLPQQGTRVLVPAGSVFREQNIILSPAGDDGMPRFFGPRLFMGAAAIGSQGVMQADIILVAAERRLIERADEVILLVDSSKFRVSSGTVVCGLEEVDIIITDSALRDTDAAMIEAAGVKLVVADIEPHDIERAA